MDRDELFEEIRTLLREPQTATVANPYRYTDLDLVPQIRSALRYLRTTGVPSDAVMDTTGTLTTEPDETEGMLIAFRVAAMLLSGDLIKKLNDGELGVLFKAGPDTLDTKTATKSFETAAASYQQEFQKLLTIVLADVDGGTNNVFGSQNAVTEGGIEV